MSRCLNGVSTAAVSDCWSDLGLKCDRHQSNAYFATPLVYVLLRHTALLCKSASIAMHCQWYLCRMSMCMQPPSQSPSQTVLYKTCLFLTVSYSQQDHRTATALQMAYLLQKDSLLRDPYPVRSICTSAVPVGPTPSFLYSLYCFCSGPLVKNGAEHMNCLHKSYSLPGEIKLPGQDASPPVKVPKGMRSNRLRRQGPNAATALGVKRNGGTSRVAKSSSTVQDEFIKVCPHHHHQVTM